MKGILFKPEMIQAIMEGRKTITRRIIKSKHESGLFEVCKRKIDGQVTEITSLDWNDRPKNGCTGDIRPKYKVGEVIYVKEGWTEWDGEIQYKVSTAFGEELGKWKNTMFMPARVARTFLKITNVRVEKLGDITADDITKEGVGLSYQEWITRHPIQVGSESGCALWELMLKDAWKDLWRTINKSYDPDQWLFVYEFTVVDNPKL